MGARKYRVGIIGLSGITSGSPQPPGPRAAWQGWKVGAPFEREIIISHAACLALMENVEVVGYCDLVAASREKFKEDWGSCWPDARPYADYKEMLAAAELDILTIATGDHRHAQMCVDGAGAGVRAIMVEKPLATSMADANRMLEACAQNKVPLSVGHTRAWDPLYHKVRDMIRADLIGPLATIYAFQGGSRAMLFRNGTHVLHGVVFFADAPPQKTWAKLEDGFDDWDEYRGDGGKDPDMDPGVEGYIEFDNGAQAFFSSNKKTLTGSYIRLVGSRGQISFGLNDGFATLQTQEAASGEDISKIINPVGITSNYQQMGYVAAYQELIDLAAKGAGQSAGSGQQARHVVQVMMGFLKSHQAGCALVDVPQ